MRYIKNPDNGGVGLAAPQVGVNKRIIAVSLMRDGDDENYRTIAMINPEITEHTEEMNVTMKGVSVSLARMATWIDGNASRLCI